MYIQSYICVYEDKVYFYPLVSVNDHNALLTLTLPVDFPLRSSHRLLPFPVPPKKQGKENSSFSLSELTPSVPRIMWLYNIFNVIRWFCLV